MSAFANMEPGSLIDGHIRDFDQRAIRRLNTHPLDCITTEYPHYVRSMDDIDDIRPPSEEHPIFYGCYDWHSAVHSHWSLLRLLRIFPSFDEREAIINELDTRFTPEKVASEQTYLENHPFFEQPYGRAWLLRLQAELTLWSDPIAEDWQSTLEPLVSTAAASLLELFDTQSRPLRVGTHQNSAFAMACMLDFARVTDTEEIATATLACARDFFGEDTAYPVKYEPLGWDFLSPALIEIDLMRRVFDSERFLTWLEAFLPAPKSAALDELLQPISITPGSHGGIELHLVGANVSKAWCLAGLADELPSDHLYHDPIRTSATAHTAQAVNQVFIEEYAGTHWLTSFFLYLISRNEGGIAPS